MNNKSQKRTKKCDKSPYKKADFYDEIVKMLNSEYELCLINEQEAIKKRNYYDAIYNKEHASSVDWMLREIESYKENGRWL